MTNADFVPATVLSRKAVVYVRPFTQTRSRSIARASAASTILSRTLAAGDFAMSTSSMKIPAGPQAKRWPAPASSGSSPASAPASSAQFLCFDTFRLSRNGRDQHHLLELCGLVGARVIDPDGVYEPGRSNDRLLLGMKGSISEFELGILRSRTLDAARSKARRGELRIPVPIGSVWHQEIGLGLDPDRRVQEVARRISSAFTNWAVPGSCI